MNTMMLEEREMSKAKKLKYKSMISRLTVHGAADLYESTSFIEKFVWTSVILTALTLAVVEIYLTITTYVESPILTSYAVVPQSEMRFPSVYVCPMNFVNKNTPVQFNATVIQRYLGRSKGDGLLDKINTNYDKILSKPSKTRLVRTVVDLFRAISMNAEEFVKECAFHRRPIGCDTVVRQMFDPDYGQCFLFNTSIPQKVAGYGLSVALDIHTDMYHSEIETPFDGVFVKIADRFDQGGTASGILVQPGGWTKINLAARYYNLINVDTGKVKQRCENETSGKTYDVLNFDHYSVSNCKIDCTLRICFEHLNCTLPTEKEFVLERYRNSACTFDKASEFYVDVLPKVEKKLLSCFEKCLTPCAYWEYVKTISFIKFAERKDATQTDVNKTLDNKCSPFTYKDGQSDESRWCTDTIILDISFSDLIYTKIVQSHSMTLDTFLGNIGGQVGLWLGVSVISVVQVLIISFVYCVEKYCRRQSDID